jgi:FtsP/CotA-like multicopper oxidase with cupredoxin domain
LALPGHSFKVVALDGNPVPIPIDVPVLWLGTAERISAIVEMSHPGVWIMDDLADDDRAHGMGIVIEYAGQKAKPQWSTPRPFKWDYTRFGKPGGVARSPDEVIEMTFAENNAAKDGFNEIDGAHEADVPYPRRQTLPATHAQCQRRHPSHPFAPPQFRTVADRRQANGRYHVGGYQEIEVDFVADNPGLTLFHCHQQLHMDFGLMALFDYV